MLTLQEAKDFLRLEHDEEDAFVSSLLLAGSSYIKNATHSQVDETSELFKVALRMLILHWYENRNTVVIGKIPKSLEFALESILIQLAYTSGDEPT